MYFANSVGN